MKNMHTIKNAYINYDGTVYALLIDSVMITSFTEIVKFLEITVVIVLNK